MGGVTRPGPQLLGAARPLRPLNASQAREIHLEALTAAMWVGTLDVPGVREAAEASHAAPPLLTPRPADALPDALALLLTEEYAAGATARRRALDLLLASGADVGQARRRLFPTSGRAVSAEHPDPLIPTST